MSDSGLIPDEIEAGIIPLARLHDTAGIDLFREMLSGKLPPAHIAKLMNFTLVRRGRRDGRLSRRSRCSNITIRPALCMAAGWRRC